VSPESSDPRGAHWLAVATRMRGRAERAEDREHALRMALQRISEGMDGEMATAVARDALGSTPVA
jgi:hypothetical protein